jgi:predicted nucleic acid-binding protein
MAIVDGQIAAIAMEQNIQLATRNTKGFAHGAIGLINPWEHRYTASPAATPLAQAHWKL